MDGARVALVVANDQYADPGLRRLVAPAQDAAALAEALADPAVGGFEVRVLQNESAQAIRLAVEDFFADRSPADLLLLHFSCHGLKNAAGELFLAVADTKPTRLASTAVAADFVNRQMADSRAQRIALFLDCCYGGAFPRGMVVRAAGEAQVRDAFAGQERVGGGRGRVVVTASSAMEYAFEGADLATDASKPAPSVFTSAVVDGLLTGEADRDGDGWVGLTELVGFVTDRVHRVTPNQNPQMWTFGSQGELLIARSRVRRITPTPLAPEVLEAMESPLPATRFGIVDYLRERLHDSDLGQAYAAWQALHRLIDDDSRKVSEAAQRSIEGAVPRAAPDVLDLGTADEGIASGEVRLVGPPIALTAVASSGVDWVRVEQVGAAVRVSAEPPSPGEHEATVILAGPTGECMVPVRVRVPDIEPAPEPPPIPPPEPQPAPTPEPQPTPEPLPTPTPEPEPSPVPHPTPEPPAATTPQPAQEATAPPPQQEAATPQPVHEAAAAQSIQQAPAAGPHVRRAAPAGGSSSGREAEQVAASRPPTLAGTPHPPGEAVVPWWAVIALTVGALVLLLVNWPGEPETRNLWYDESTGWHVYRSWSDPLILSSFVALVASVAARWSGQWVPLVLGVLAGSVASVLEDGVLILGAGIADAEVGTWVTASAVAAGMACALLAVLRPRSLPRWPLPLPGAVLVVAGGTLLVVSSAIRHGDGNSFLTVTTLALLEPVIIVALAWLALAATDSAARQWLSATAVTAALISIVAAVPALTEGNSQPAFLTAMAGNLAIIAGTAFAAQRQLQPAAAAQPPDAVRRAWPPPAGEAGTTRWFRQRPAVIAAAVGVGALVLAVANLAGIDRGQKLWYNADIGSPYLYRDVVDGTIWASAVALLGAAFGWQRGRRGAYALGVAAGALALFSTAAVVVLGGRIAVDDAVYVWAASLLIAGLALAFVLAGAGLAPADRRPDQPTGLVLAAGFLLLVVFQLVPDESGPSAAIYTRGLALLLPVVAVALVLLVSTTAGNPVTIGMAGSYLVLFIAAALYPITTEEAAPSYFTAMLCGHAVLLAALVLSVRRAWQEG